MKTIKVPDLALEMLIRTGSAELLIASVKYQYGIEPTFTDPEKETVWGAVRKELDISKKRSGIGSIGGASSVASRFASSKGSTKASTKASSVASSKASTESANPCEVTITRLDPYSEDFVSQLLAESREKEREKEIPSPEKEEKEKNQKKEKKEIPLLEKKAEKESECGTEVITPTSSPSLKTSNRFSKPTSEEVQEYCNQRGNGINGEEFCDFYESKGWMVGKNPMKDWRAAVRTWERQRGFSPNQPPSPRPLVGPKYFNPFAEALKQMQAEGEVT